MDIEFVLTDVEVPVKKVEELLFHQVDFGLGETKSFVCSHVGVLGPMLVLGRGVVEELCSQDESSKEDSVHSTSQTLGNWWQSLLESLEVNQRGHQSGNLHI